MAEDAGRRRAVKKTEAESPTASRTEKPAATTSDEPVSPRSKGDGTSTSRTRLGSTKDSPSKTEKEKEKSKAKDKDKDGRNKHALSRTAQRQNSIMPVPMPSPDKVEEIFRKLLVRLYIFRLLMQNHGHLLFQDYTISLLLAPQAVSTFLARFSYYLPLSWIQSPLFQF